MTVEGLQFRLDGRPYRYAGANMWYGAYLGTDAAYGDRARLGRELDRLAALGVDNIRVLGSSEESPLKHSIKPAFQDRGRYNETLLKGLDFLLAEMGRRRMKAVIYLTNFWEWSGGMATYLYWTNGGRYIDMNDPAHPWPEFPDFVAGFYRSPAAVELYHDYIRTVVTRTNALTGVRYRDDPAIMAWQLANEPRPGGSDRVGAANLPAFYAWVRKTAALIKALDPDHLVCTGSEGLQGCLGQDACVIDEHAPPQIDYLTAHIWPQNWDWLDPRRMAETDAGAHARVADYIDSHIALARRLNKPLVIEEFGYPRDGGGYDPGTPTTYKDRFYGQIYEAVLRNPGTGPLVGSNFWAWSGEGRSQEPDYRFRPGDVGYLGDPPHEPQGWYGVFDTDASTQAVIRAHARALKAL